MSLFDMFTKPAEAAPAQVPTTPAAPVQPGQPGNLPANAPDANAPLGNDASPAQAAPETPDSPLDPYKDLWDTVPNAAAPDAAPQQLDPAKLQEVINKANFSQNLPAETLAKIAAGGEEAQAALPELLNSVAQNVMMQSTLASNKMIEQAVASVNSAWEAKIPEMMRKQSLSNTLVDSNPVFNNPAVKPVIEAVQSQLAARNPSATPVELAKMAEDFVTVMGEQLAPSSTPDAQQNVNAEDWEKFMTVPLN